MVLIDADVLIVDQRYLADIRFATNRQFLTSVKHRHIAIGMTTQGLFEVMGILSFGLSISHIRNLARRLENLYQLTIFPDYTLNPEFAGCTFQEIVDQMTLKMSLGDAIQAIQIAKFASTSSMLITWNAKHFVGKVPVPVMTPAEWLAANP